MKAPNPERIWIISLIGQDKAPMMQPINRPDC